MSTYMNMTFTGTVGTDVDGLAPDSGGGTITAAVANNNSTKLSGTGTASRVGPNSAGAHWWSVTVPVADYQVDHVLDFKSILSTDIAMVFARLVDESNYYRAYVTQAGVLILDKVIANAATGLGSSTTVSVGAGQAHTISIAVQGNAISALWDGSVVIGPITDNTYSAAGHAGFRTGQQSVLQTATTGIHSNQLLVGDLALVPTLTVAPVVSGTRVVGSTLSTTNGTWTGTPTSYARQWKRDGATISGETGSTYLLQVGDAGTTITCTVTASNANGPSSPADSNGLLIAGAMAAGDIQFVLAAAGGLGGSPGGPVSTPTSVFDSVTFSEANDGDVEYRVVYLQNTHPVQSLGTAEIWVSAQTTSPTTDIAIGVAPEAAGVDVTAIPDEQTPPVGVTFSAPASQGTALAVGTLGPDEARGIWLRRTVLAGTVELASDTCTVAWDGTPA